jgi:hypothetical protein
MEIDKNNFYSAVGNLLTKTARQLRLDIPAIKRATGLQYTTIKRMMEGEGFMFHHVVPVAEVLGLELQSIVRYAVTYEGTNEKESIDDLI